jgi:hypothetical protein
MTILEMDKISNELYDECRELNEEYKIKLNKIISKKLKSEENKLKSRTEYWYTRKNIMDSIFANINYDIVWSYDNYLEDEDVISFEEE